MCNKTPKTFPPFRVYNFFWIKLERKWFFILFLTILFFYYNQSNYFLSVTYKSVDQLRLLNKRNIWRRKVHWRSIWHWCEEGLVKQPSYTGKSSFYFFFKLLHAPRIWFKLKVWPVNQRTLLNKCTKVLVIWRKRRVVTKK